MSRSMWVLWVALFSLALGAMALAQPAPERSSPFVARIELDGAIGPAAAEYFDDAMQRASREGAVAVVLRLDTPGGLAESMRQIVSGILASRLPVIGYVAPDGARAASAGTYILYACHVAAMAPATHLGAATPVSLGGGTPMPSPLGAPAPAGSAEKPAAGNDATRDAEANKVLNDAIAYIRSLAQLRGRDAAWAEQAVRGAATLTANEAVTKHVVDFVATDANALLVQSNGRKVQIAGQVQVLQLTGLPLRDYAPNWRTRFLGIITNPTIAYVLLLAGIYGLVLEAFHPGAWLPGIVGGICLLIGLYALQLLPVNYAGLTLMALGVALLLTEALTPTVGAVGVGGVIAFVIGSIMLFNTGVPGYAVNIGVIAGIAFCAIALLALILRLVMRARRTRPFSGDEQVLQATGELLQAVQPDSESWALVGGERWRVHCDTSLPAGARVRVLRREGLQLWVTPL
ncbi:membrane-bound serine protease (ClpP class) [Dyella sp. OK004]|uniref:NfeD family protein n=1 Tax=Dyella sp. OK004 TaxID=1855292 RepID=UPI0008EADE9B|nr:nodulation protein NfeD [Dyella sp. OK004]SFS02326.1 membrane-bound serine protease (ClpP class) [Dyella sp. OK004]